jgi:hypothetical protein
MFTYGLVGRRGEDLDERTARLSVAARAVVERAADGAVLCDSLGELVQQVRDPDRDEDVAVPAIRRSTCWPAGPEHDQGRSRLAMGSGLAHSWRLLHCVVRRLKLGDIACSFLSPSWRLLRVSLGVCVSLLGGGVEERNEDKRSTGGLQHRASEPAHSAQWATRWSASTAGPATG